MKELNQLSENNIISNIKNIVSSINRLNTTKYVDYVSQKRSYNTIDNLKKTLCELLYNNQVNTLKLNTRTINFITSDEIIVMLSKMGNFPKTNLKNLNSNNINSKPPTNNLDYKLLSNKYTIEISSVSGKSTTILIKGVPYTLTTLIKNFKVVDNKNRKSILGMLKKGKSLTSIFTPLE